ncbi:TPA: hypothetical protein R8G32_003071 [Citrobacter braakii]|nr:hypothetical protein [Citrobacter braakii]
MSKHVGYFVPAADFQHQPLRKGRAAGDDMSLRLVIQITLMTNAGMKYLVKQTDSSFIE